MEVTVLNRQRTHPINPRALETFVRRVVREAPHDGGASSVAVCLVSDARMREFNQRYRDKDATTDVLSFPGDDEPEPDGSVYLGDIVVSVATAARQAREAGHSVPRELKRLVLHGYLHLLGYDHETDDGEMLRLERRLVRRLLPASGRTRPARPREGRA